MLNGFLPPGYNALRTTLLQQEKEQVERLLKSIKSTRNAKGVSIVSDGWTDVQRRPLIHFMATIEGGPIFLKAINVSDEIKNKHYMRSYKRSRRTKCSYAACNWITQVVDDVSFVRNFIINHSMRLAIFNHFSPLKLLVIVETRFASILVMLKRFKLLKGSLQPMVISEEWNSYREDDVGKAQAAKEFILNDAWWDKITYILNFTEPIYSMLRACAQIVPHFIWSMRCGIV
uniref:DUF659 domain-containing protein n=1 Tax=Cajanus cajan TaxID=3821 RepID=A0A151QLS8_CAJCA|nr:hypothetical protein KK1_048583 [Cajanus cajan]